MKRTEVAIVGSGFAGTLLARALTARGISVTVLDRARHPRFALGESSTPLGNLSLERLARRYGLADCRDLARWGTWRRRWPAVGRGLKRGFTFFDHTPGRPWANGPANEARLLVAASPNDEVADTHWLRAEVDAHFARRARSEGVRLIEGAEVTGVTITADGVSLELALEGAAEGGSDGESERISRGAAGISVERLACDLVIDASGAASVVSGALGVGEGRPLRTRSSLIYAHLEDVRLFAEVAAVAGSPLADSPYPDDLAAVHHLTPEGWVYALRFDGGWVSAGLLTPGSHGGGGAAARRSGRARTSRGERSRSVERRRSEAEEGAPSLAGPESEPHRAWEAFLERYPSLVSQFGGARPLRPWAAAPSIQYRRAAAAGPRWAALPHAYAFVDPLFSTGIAWSLLAVERLAGLVTELGPDHAEIASGEAFNAYGALLEAEAEQIDRLVSGAYAALGDLRRFAAHSLVYFAAVSWAETSQRLVGASPGARRPAHCPGCAAAWDGFLGVGEPVVGPLVAESAERVAASAAAGEDPAAYERWVREAIAPRDLVGLDAPAAPNLYPADLDVLVDRAPRLLGLSRAEVLAALPRLRGDRPAA